MISTRNIVFRLRRSVSVCVGCSLVVSCISIPYPYKLLVIFGFCSFGEKQAGFQEISFSTVVRRCVCTTMTFPRCK